MKRIPYYIMYTLSCISILLGIIACIAPAPSMDGDKVETTEDGETKYEQVMPWNAKDRIDRALESKGFKRYKVDVAQIAAKNWVNLSYYSGILSGVFILLWYLTKTREFGGAAILSVLVSLWAVLMAELVGISGWIKLVIGSIFQIGIGIGIRNKSLVAYLKTWKQRRKGSGPTEHGT